jgi:serine/threonine-protein kinase
MLDWPARALRLSLLFFAAVGFSAHAEEWKNYQNARFGTKAQIPAGWTALPEPANGDGIELESPDKRASITISGGYNEPPTAAGLEDISEPEKGATVTYKKRGPGWIVISGTKGNLIFYQKYLLSCENEVWNSVTIQYPAVDKASYDAIVKHAADGLRGARGKDAEHCR